MNYYVLDILARTVTGPVTDISAYSDKSLHLTSTDQAALEDIVSQMNLLSGAPGKVGLSTVQAAINKGDLNVDGAAQPWRTFAPSGGQVKQGFWNGWASLDNDHTVMVRRNGQNIEFAGTATGGTRNPSNGIIELADIDVPQTEITFPSYDLGVHFFAGIGWFIVMLNGSQSSYDLSVIKYPATS